MPRIRDLGISVIPATMRPPEIGPGGGFDLTAPQEYPPYLACEDNTCLMGSICTDNTEHQCETNSCTGNSGRKECKENTRPGCQGNTCANSCPGDSVQAHPGGLTGDVVAQLKQHLHDRIGTHLEN